MRETIKETQINFTRVVYMNTAEELNFFGSRFTTCIHTIKKNQLSKQILAKMHT